MRTEGSVEVKPKPQMIVKAGKKPFSLIIIGGGPAGLTAGIYAKRARIETLLIEKALPGGLITSTDLVENYPGFPEGISGMELGQKLEDHAKIYGLEILFGKVTRIDIKGRLKEVYTEESSYSCKAVIIAAGSQMNKLGIPGEDKFIGKGVSYCAACDGPFYKDKSIVVIGGGNAALEEAIFLTKFAKMVTIIHRRETLRADKVLEEKASANPKIFLNLNSVVEEISGNAKAEKIKIRNVTTNKTVIMDTDGIFIYSGWKPNTEFLKGTVNLDEKGHIMTDERLATNIEGIYAAGDIRKKYLRQVVTAAADGAIAANSAKEYLESYRTL